MTKRLSSCLFVCAVCFGLSAGRVSADVTNLTQGGASYANIADAVTASVANDTILVKAGTYNIASTINLNKEGLTLRGEGSNTAFIAGACTLIQVTAPGVTVESLGLQLTSASGEPHNIDVVNVSNVVIRGNHLWGIYDTRTNDVNCFGISLGYATHSGGVSNVLICSNIIHDVRQPIRAEGTGNGTGPTPCTGLVADNLIYNTKGITVWGECYITWLNNRFGTGGYNLWNTYLGGGPQVELGDMAIFAAVPSNCYPDIVALSISNSYACIEDQRTSPKSLTTCYVDPASAGGNGTPCNPYATLTQAVNRICWDGTVRALSGGYTNTVTLTKSATFELVASSPVTSFDIVASPPGRYRATWLGDVDDLTRNGNTLTVVMDKSRTIRLAMHVPKGTVIEVR